MLSDSTEDHRFRSWQRGRMRGSMAKRGLNIYKRKDGRWEGRIRQADFADGRKKYHSVYGHTYREVREKMATLAAEQNSGAKSCSLSVGEVMEIWLRDKRHDWKESTYACYKQLIVRHISESIADRRAESFDNLSFRKYLDSIRKKGDGAKISAAYLNCIGTVIRQAFSYVTAEYQYRLPLLSGKQVREEGKREELPSDKDIRKMLQYLYANAEDSTCLGILLAYYTGIRIGELCALTWGDIDFEEGVLKISKNMQRVKEFGQADSETSIKIQTPKTVTSKRCIPLPESLFSVLKEKRQSAEQYLITGKRRAFAETRTVQYRFAAILKKCGIAHFKFHMLRHYFASLCIRRGCDVKSLSEILGHANIQITLNLYVHSTMQQKRRLMNKVFETEVA